MKKWTVAFLIAFASGASAQEAPPAPEEDVKGQVEGMSEALTEIKNFIDAWKKLKITGYLQAQYVHDDSSVNEQTSTTSTRNRDQFSVRRARLKFTYQATRTSRFVLQPDIASSGVTLKDGYVELTEPWTSWKHTLTAGQFTWPFGFELGYSSSSRELPERSRVIRTLFPGERDRGVQLSGRGFKERFKYQVAIVNGTGTTQPFDANKGKDFVGRAGVSLGPLDVGISGYQGSELIPNSGSLRGFEFDKTRRGIDVQWVTPVPGLGTRAEYIIGDERGSEVRGWYWYLIENLGTRHQFALRIDDYDPNRSLAGDAVRTLGGSYIFHWDENSKVMLTYELPKTERNDPDDNVFTARYQFSF